MRRFPTDQGGNFAVIFTLAALPLMAGVGVAFDYVQASSLESKLAGSLDQAAVAGIQDLASGKPKSAVEKTVRAMVLANIGAQHKAHLKLRTEMTDMRSSRGLALKVSAKLKFKPMMAPLYAAVTGQTEDQFDYVIQVP